MKELLAIYKPIGLTPLQLIDTLREQRPEYTDETIGYAGRLDPMAHGVMLLMIGEETKNRDQYLSLTKEYTFELILGLETDTYDLLGCLRKTEMYPIPKNVNLIVNSFVNTHVGKQSQSYPPYSSKTVRGKPLFWWAKNSKLDEIEIPKRDIEIFDFVVLSQEEILGEEIEKKILTTVNLIQGDFRQNEIRKRWDTFFASNKHASFTKLQCRVACSSGTYIRGLVHELGKELNCGAVTTDISRTRVGDYSLENALLLNFPWSN